MFSIYTSAFNVKKHSFDYTGAIENFCKFADDVVVAVNTSEDGSYEAFKILTESYSNLRIIPTDFSYKDPLLDGKIKNAALQFTREEFKIGLDLDERIPIRQREAWMNLAYNLRFAREQSVFIPSINLWGGYDTVRADSNKDPKYKWYLHKEGLFRGPIKQALKPDGTVNIKISDTCELIDKNGNLCPYQCPISLQNLDIKSHLEKLRIEDIFVFHLGYCDFDRRYKLNDSFWRDHWKIESGIDEDHTRSKDEIENSELIYHGLKLWND